MRIGISGSGYVGTVTGAGLAARGNEVIFVDLDPDRGNALNRAESPLFEPGLDALLANNGGRYRATTDYGELLQCDISFITVGTPSHDDGSIDLAYERSAAESIGDVIKQKDDFQARGCQEHGDTRHHR